MNADKIQKKFCKNNSKKLKITKTIIKDRYFWFQTGVCKNVFNEILLAWFKFQVKIPRRSGLCVSDKNTSLPTLHSLKTKDYMTLSIA